MNFTPIMLDFPTDLRHDFKERHSSKTNILEQFDMPDGSPREGELVVKKTFPRQWDLLNHDNISFGFTPELRDEFVKLELDWPEFLTKPRSKY